MNVGIVIAFSSALRGTEYAQRFAHLQGMLEGWLGLSQPLVKPPPHCQCKVINLDHRNLRGHANDELVAGMLRKLDPEAQPRWSAFSV
jgi:hypothetical protein